MEKTSKNSINTTIILVLFCLMAAANIAYNNTGLSSKSIIVLSALMLLVKALGKGGKISIKLTKYHYYIFAFAMFCMVSGIWAVKSPSAAITTGFTILKILLCMSAVICCFQDGYYVPQLLKAIMWSGPVVVVYSVWYYGFSNFIYMLQNSQRLGNTYANSNAVGMWMAVSVSLFVFFILNEGFRLRHIAIALPLILLAASQSRTGLVEAAAGVILVFYFDLKRSGKTLRGFIKLVIAVSALLIALKLLSKMSFAEGIIKRMNSFLGFFSGEKVDGSTATRTKFIVVGLQQFLKTPLLGIGISNSDVITRQAIGWSTYLHNNFVELLATGGIIGFWLFYRIYYYIGKRLISQTMQRVMYSEACLSLLLISLLADMGTVSYYVKSMFVLFTVSFLQIYTYSKQNIMGD